jgi:hypothetical protein
VEFATELILGHGGLGEESNYDYSKPKRKGKGRERKASYSTINTRCVCALAALLILRTLVTEVKSEAILKCLRPWGRHEPERVPKSYERAACKSRRSISHSLLESGTLSSKVQACSRNCSSQARKASYDVPGAWRPIALLNTIGKLIEAITAKRLRDAVEEYGLLPGTQMGARQGRSTETALELLIEQVRTVWKSKKHVATMLSLDIAGAFDTINPARLLDILRKKGFPGWVVRWVREFITARTTTLVIQGVESELFEVEAGVPQGLTLSPILFLLYNSELLRICNQAKKRDSAVGFADDVNILTHSTSTERNCRTIEDIHTQCGAWARRQHELHPSKYELYTSPGAAEVQF